MNTLQAAQNIADQLSATPYAEIYGAARVMENWLDEGSVAVIWDAPGWATNDRYELFAEAAAEMSAMGMDPGDYSDQEEKTWFKEIAGFWSEPYNSSVLVVGKE